MKIKGIIALVTLVDGVLSVVPTTAEGEKVLKEGFTIDPFMEAPGLEEIQPQPTAPEQGINPISMFKDYLATLDTKTAGVALDILEQVETTIAAESVPAATDIIHVGEELEIISLENSVGSPIAKMLKSVIGAKGKVADIIDEGEGFVILEGFKLPISLKDVARV